MSPEEEAVVKNQMLAMGMALSKHHGKNEIKLESEYPEGVIEVAVTVTPHPLPDNVIPFNPNV